MPQSPQLWGFTKISKAPEDEQPEQPPKKLSFDASPSVSERIPYSNRRPITMITFPSNPKIETENSPTKLVLGHKSSFGGGTEDDGVRFEQFDPSKKLKT